MPSSLFLPGNSKLPIGAILPFAGNVTPDWEAKSGFMICDGRQLDRKKYPKLFDAIGTCWGGDATDTFHIPDLRGLFIRGVSMDSGNDPDATARSHSRPGGHTGNQVGSVQSSAFESHSHVASVSTHIKGRVISNTLAQESEWRCGFEGHPTGAFSDGGQLGMDRFDPGLGAHLQNTGGNETRPKNASVYYVICTE